MSLGVMLWYHVGVGHPLMRYILARLVACLTVSRHLSGVEFAIESMIVRGIPANKERSYGNFLVHFESCNDNLVGY